MRKTAAGLIAALALWTGGAHAQSFEAYCNRDGLAPALRQSVILLDEHDVLPEPGGAPNGANQPWRQFLGALLLPANQAQLEQNFLPRERVTIAIVRKDGTGLRTVFTGCLPFYSAAERTKLASDAGMMRSVHEFFGSGPAAAAKRDMDLFRIQLGNAFKSALDPAMLSAPGSERGDAIANSSFAASLKQGRLFNPYYGLPRVVLVADLGRLFRGLPGERAAARNAGYHQGAQADIDFGNAELYLAGLKGGGPVLRDGLEAFALASHAELVALGSTASLPAFRPPPRRVIRYQGLIVYPDNRFPVRIRLAADDNGSLVNSWLSVQTSNEQYAPLHGVLTCVSGGECSFSGDQQFAQLWNPTRGSGAAPSFSENLPFGGARTVHLAIHDGRLTGDISDPLIRFQGVKNFRLEFSASPQPAAQF